jgi:uncharacterized protein (TIGR03435 family)
VTIPQLVEHQLELYAGRPTFDKTGLTVPYDFTLEFLTEQAPPGEEESAFRVSSPPYKSSSASS